MKKVAKKLPQKFFQGYVELDLEDENFGLGAIQSIQRGLNETNKGAGRPAREVLEKIRAKYKIPRRLNRNSQKKKVP